MDARRKFQGRDRELELADLVDQASRPADLADLRNGRKLRFPARLAGRVGTPMLEGLREAADLAWFPGARLKLGRLRGRALGELTLLGRSRPPGAPNRGRRSPAMLALHAGRIWIETSIGPVQDRFLRGHYSDRRRGDRESAQTVTRQRGPGEIRFSTAAVRAEWTRNREAGERAGVKPPAAIARPHEAGEFRKLRRDFAAVNGGAA